MRPIHYLGVFIPVAIALELAHAGPVLIFVTAALGVIPCAAVMGEATEAIAARTGPGIGGLLNVTFGNAPELIIAFFALIEGLQEVVKASLVGSIIGNILLVMGAAMIVGGWGREKQVFSRTAVSAQVGMLTLALAALVFPAIFQLIHGGHLPPVGADQVDFGSDLEHLSLGVALVLLLSYAAGLYFSLKTHRDVFNPFGDREEEEQHEWPVKRAAIYLAAVGGGGGRDVGDPRGLDLARRRRRSACRSSSSACSSWRSWATPPSTGSPCSSPRRTRWTWR